jgi:hypothetical protein
MFPSAMAVAPGVFWSSMTKVHLEVALVNGR